MLVHLIRHTTPDIAAGVCYGQADLGLAKSFADEKQHVLSRLLGHYDAVYTSPLTRCKELANCINSGNLSSDERLMEYNFGDWELRPWSQLSETETQNWMNDFIHQAPPQGETLLAMQARVSDFFTELYQQPYNTVAVVSHAGVLRLLHQQITGARLSELFRLKLDYGAIIEIENANNEAMQTIKFI